MALGSAYFMGDGIRQDDVIAYMWLKIAAPKHPPAKRVLDAVAPLLSSTELARAQDFVAECMVRDFVGCAE